MWVSKLRSGCQSAVVGPRWREFSGRCWGGLGSGGRGQAAKPRDLSQVLKLGFGAGWRVEKVLVPETRRMEEEEEDQHCG